MAGRLSKTMAGCPAGCALVAEGCHGGEGPPFEGPLVVSEPEVQRALAARQRAVRRAQAWRAAHGAACEAAVLAV